MTIGQWQAKAKAKMVVVGGLKIMRKLTFAPFLCLLAFSPPTNTRNTQYKARASRKHGRRQGWSHHFGLLLLLGLYLFMLFLGLTLHAWQNPGFLDTIHPPNPLLDYLKFMAFFFSTSSFFGGSLCIVIDFRAGGEVFGLRAVCRIRLSFWPEENLLKTLSLGAWRGFPFSRPKEQRARVKVSERYFWVDLKDASELFTAQVHFAFVVLCVFFSYMVPIYIFGVALGPKVMPLGPGKYLPNVLVVFGWGVACCSWDFFISKLIIFVPSKNTHTYRG